MAKVEVYQYPIVGIFPRLWDVIPVHREDVDRQALRKAFQVLEAGEIILLAPEGTRNPSLRRGREGVAYIGARSGVPIIPIAVTGTQGFPSVNPALWRSPGAKLRIGVPFKFRTPHGKPTREQLRVMTDEAMYVLAEMLPEELRGEYKDLRKATSEYIEPIPQLEGCHQG
jgi:1-acyl-sn-glycerol-3-phosphate acyltransferase